jgi:hypothetical protein
MNRLAVSTGASAWSRQQSQSNAAALTSAANLSASWSGYDQSVTGSTLYLIPGRKVSTSLAGKARSIFSGGAEQTRLRSIRSVFPHEDSTQITNIADIYAEALGYFRFVIPESFFVHLPHIVLISPGSHCDAFKTTIAHLFLAQIRTGHVHYLRNALDDLSSFENQHSLAVIMTTSMDDIDNL